MTGEGEIIKGNPEDVEPFGSEEISEGAEKVVEHFAKELDKPTPRPDADPPIPTDVDAEVDSLVEQDPTKLSERLLLKFRDAKLNRKRYEAEEERLKELLKKLWGKGEPGSETIGKAILLAKNNAGKTTVAWEKWARAISGDVEVDKLLETKKLVSAKKVTDPYVKRSEDTMGFDVMLVRDRG